MPLPASFSLFGGVNADAYLGERRLMEQATANRRADARSAQDAKFRQQMMERQFAFDQAASEASQAFRTRELDANIANREALRGLEREKFDFNKGTTSTELEQRARKQRMDEMFRGRDAARLEKGAEASLGLAESREAREAAKFERMGEVEAGIALGRSWALDMIPSDPEYLREMIGRKAGREATDAMVNSFMGQIEARREQERQEGTMKPLDERRTLDVQRAKVDSFLGVDVGYQDALAQMQTLQRDTSTLEGLIAAAQVGSIVMTPEQIAKAQNDLAEARTNLVTVRRQAIMRRQEAMRRVGG